MLSKPFIALSLFVFGIFFIIFSDVFVKIMSDSLNIFQLLSTRSIIACVILLAINKYCLKQLLALDSTILYWLLLRGFFLSMALTLYFLSLSVLAIAEVAAVFFTYPLFLQILSHFMLKEYVSYHRISAVIVGFIGALMVIQPSGDGDDIYYILLLVAACLHALFLIVTRKINSIIVLPHIHSVSSLQIVLGLYSILAIIIINMTDISSNVPAMQFLLHELVWPSWQYNFYITLGSVAILVYAFAIANVYNVLQASFVAPFEYTGLVASAIWGYIFFHNTPDNFASFGIALIMISGLYITYREHIIKHRQAMDNASNDG